MALQVVQVIYPIVPGGMTSVIGYIAFGPIWGFVYNFTGIFIGSLIAFALARRYGETFVKAFVSQETYDKYIGYLDKNNGKSYAMILGAAFAPLQPPASAGPPILAAAAEHAASAAPSE